jgi:adenine-specific DNA-methyltransferase
VQISDENIHHIRELMDEVFGSDNFIAIIPFRKTGGLVSNFLDTIFDFIIWYSRDKKNTKYRQLFLKKAPGEEGAKAYRYVIENGRLKEVDLSMTIDPNLICTHGDLTSQGNPIIEFNFQDRVFRGGWKTTIEGLKKLAKKNRIALFGSTLRYVRYLSDFPYFPINQLWADTGVSGFASEKIYVVQTLTTVIQRCLLMATDPGDIVLDPTCGSGTTAYVAEQWGRRWITVDTSRVALALARTRLMTAKFPYYKLENEKIISTGFIYRTVPHITLKSLANDEPAEQEVLYDQPLENKDIVRVAGPFTVESLSPHRVSDAQEMLSSEQFVETIKDNLLKSGVQTGQKGARVQFVNLDILPQGPEIQLVGEYKTNEGLKKVAVAIGPEFGSVDDDFIRDAATIAKKFADLIIVAATSFEAAAFSEPTQTNGLQVMKVKINPDLSMGDLLKKTGSGNLFLAFGEPEVKVKQSKEGVIVEIVGVDIYDPVKSEIRSSGSGDPEHEIAAWFIDTNYNGEAFFVTHAYFLGADKPYEKLKKALKADIDEQAWEELYSTVSRPFPKPKTGKIAIKVINHYGDEVMKIVEIK